MNVGDINALVTPTPGMRTLKIALASWLELAFETREARDVPHGLRILYLDDSRAKMEPTEDAAKALWLLKEMSQLLGGYQGFLTLFEVVGNPNILSNNLTRATPPHGLEYTEKRLPSVSFDVGVSINSPIGFHRLAELLRDGIIQGGFALVHSQIDPSKFRGPDKQEEFADSTITTYFANGFKRREIVKSPVFDDDSQNSVLLVMERN